MHCACTHEVFNREDTYFVAAKVQCLVTVLSDMKSIRDTSYFDGENSDGKTSMRVYGCNEGVRRKLEFYKSSVRRSTSVLDNSAAAVSRTLAPSPHKQHETLMCVRSA